MLPFDKIISFGRFLANIHQRHAYAAKNVNMCVSGDKGVFYASL
jgi:hypothetical protein